MPDPSRTPHATGEHSSSEAAPRWGVRWVRLSLGATAAVSLISLIVFLSRPPSVIHFRDSSRMVIVALETLALCASGLALWRWLRKRSPPLRPGVSLRIGLYAFVAGSVVYLIFFQPFKALFFLFFWGCWSGWYPLLLLAGPWLGGKIPSAWRRGADLVLFNVTVLLVGGELLLSVLAALWPIPLFARESNVALDVIEQHRFEPGQIHLGFACDSRGNYDREPRKEAGRPLITAIGDSFSVGVVPHYHHYTTVCERQLAGAEIYNIGVNAVGPVEYLYLLEEEALPLEPDAVLIGIFVGNDVHDAIRFRPHFPWLRRWFDRNSTLLYLVPKRLIQIATERDRVAGAGVARVQGEARPGLVDQTPENLADRFPWVADPRLERPTFSEETFFDIEHTRALGLCVPGERHFFEVFFEALEEIRRVADPVPLLVVMIPDEFQVEDRLWNQLVERRLGERALERDRPQRLIGRWLAERGIPVLDLLPILREEPVEPDGWRHLYHRRDTHLNARGNRVAGEALAQFLRQHLPSLREKPAVR